MLIKYLLLGIVFWLAEVIILYTKKDNLTPQEEKILCALLWLYPLAIAFWPATALFISLYEIYGRVKK